MRDYRLILTRDGVTGKQNIQGNFYPECGSWDINDFENGIRLLQFGENWYRECIARLKKEKIQIEKEIDGLIGRVKKEKQEGL